MKLAIVLVLILSALLPAAPLQDISDSSAMTKAQGFWGKAARMERTRKFGDSNWTFRIGFDSPDCRDDFTVVGTGSTWTAAFVDAGGKEILGTYSGKTFLMTAEGTFSQTTKFSSAFTFPFQYQFFIDGNAVGKRVDPVRNTDGTWTATTQWDSTTIPNGLHVLCGKLFSSDGSFGATNAAMMKVQN